MKKLATVVLAVLVLVAPSALAARKSSVKIMNHTKWDIHHLYLSSSQEDEWGPDQLGDVVLAAARGKFTLRSIPCDEYDVKIVDEDGDECVIEGVELCADHFVWNIKNSDLLECEGYE